jgi:hypothetical protein
MNITVLVFSAVLFFVLTPGILVTLPKNGSKVTIAAVHALIFAVVFHFSNKLVVHLSEGFKEGKCNRCPAGYYHPSSSNCSCKKNGY